jgi:hypothetical protein
VYDSLGHSLESSFGAYAVRLTLAPASSIDGSLQATTSQGLATFSSLRILSQGTYTLTASPATLSTSSLATGASPPLTIADTLYSVTVSTSTDTPTAFFNFYVYATLRGQDAALLAGTWGVTMAENNNSPFVGNSYVSSSNGVAAFYVYFTESGAKAVSMSCAAMSSLYSAIVVQREVIRMSFTPVRNRQPVNSRSSFSVTVGVYNSDGSVLESTNGNYQITLALSPTATVRGTWQLPTGGGQAVFSSLYILTASSYTLTASTPNMASVISGSFTTSNYLVGLSLSALPTTPTEYFTITVTATLTGDDNGPYFGVCSVSLSEPSGFVGTPSLPNSSGSVSFSIYFSSTGNKVLSGSSGSISSTLSLQVQGRVLLFTSQPPSSLTSRTVFAVTVGIYDHAGSLPETRLSYSVSLSLMQTGSLSGTVTGSTTAGQATFSGLTLLTAGSFNIQAAVAGLPPVQSSSFQVTTQIGTVSVVAVPASPTVNFQCAFLVTLKADDGTSFMALSSVSFSAANLVGMASTENTSNSTVTFYGYYTTTGTYSAMATAGGTTGTVSVNVLSLGLKIVSFSPTVLLI